MRYLKGFVLFSLMVLGGTSFAQETNPQYNPNSIDPIPKYEQLFKKRVWVNVDLKEKQNKGFFAVNSELPQFIIDAVKSGELAEVIYQNDSLTTKMTKEEFMDKLVAVEAVPVDPWDADTEYYEGDEISYGGRNYVSRYDENLGITPGTDDEYWEVKEGGGAEVYLPQQISVMRLMEDRIFDRRRSRLYYDVQSIEIIIPGTETISGIDVEVATFSYKDLAKVFRNHPEEAVWFNSQNSAENKNFADAFLLRLFHGNLVKVENPDNFYIVDVYDKSRKEGVMASEWLDVQLMEKEHNLWEF